MRPSRVRGLTRNHGRPRTAAGSTAPKVRESVDASRASPASSNRPSRSTADTRLTSSRAGIPGIDGHHQLARPRRSTEVGRGVDEQPVAGPDGRRHAASRDRDACTPRTGKVLHAGRQGRSQRGQDEAGPKAGEGAPQEGRPPLVCQKMSAMAATCASSSAAAAASTDCLHLPACLRAFQKRSWRSGCASRCSGLK